MTDEMQTQETSGESGRAADEESFEQLFEQSLNLVKQGEVVIGTLLRADPDTVLIDIGYKSEGIVSAQEFNDLEEEPIGQEVEVFLEKLEVSQSRGRYIVFLIPSFST